MADSKVINQSVYDLRVVRDAVKNNRSRGSQADIEFIPRVLRDLQSRLGSLREREDGILDKLYRHLSKLERDGLKSDRLQKKNLVQEYVRIAQDPDPDFASIYVMNKLRRSHSVIHELFKIRMRVAHDIKEVNSAINRYQRRLEKTQKIINDQKNSPKEKDLKRDQTWNRTVSEILILKQLHEAYKIRSRDVEGKEAYTEDIKIVKALNNIQLKFVAFAERNPWVVQGRIVLDLSNPGSDTNGVELNALIESLRQIGYNDKLDTETAKYAVELDKNVNDPYVSKRLRRTADLQLEPKPGDSLQEATSNFAKFIELTSNSEWFTWYTKLSLKSQAEASEKWFRRKTSRLFGNKPFCVPQPPTPEEEDRDAQKAQEQAVDAAGLEEYEKRLSRAPEPTGIITKDMVLLFSSANDEVVNEFLKNPNRLAGGVMLDGQRYGIGLDFLTSVSTAKTNAQTRALAIFPDFEVDREYQVTSQPQTSSGTALTGVLVVAVAKTE